MYKEKTICVVVPAYNEESQIAKVVETMPDFVDMIVILDDASQDATSEVVLGLDQERVKLIQHKENQGVGGAIATGYKFARDSEYDVAVVMAGDGQMDPVDLPAILEPVVTGVADYSKANRLFTGEAYKTIPKVRFFGNAVLSMLTKIASGYWHIADSQAGYTAINQAALQAIDWDQMYKRYGQPNDLLVRLNIHSFRVCDVHVRPVYDVGEKSGIRIHKVIFTIGWLIIKLFLWRLKEKYIIRDFHPLVFFYFQGFMFGVATIALVIRLVYKWTTVGDIPEINALAAMFSFMSASIFTLFAMWFDLESNRNGR